MYVCGHAYAMLYLYKSDDNIRKWVLFSYHVSLGDGTQQVWQQVLEPAEPSHQLNLSFKG